MRKPDRRFRLAAAALAALLLMTSVLPCAALAAGPDTVTLRTAADLTALARACTLNTWSRDKTVVLAADIDLTGTDFSPIPTFGGTLEGNGHTISGLSLSGGASCQGLFRYVQEGAVVRDLHVTGTVTAVGEESYLGGIAGSNEGTLLNCSFRGTVEGRSQIGGIAGINEAAGTIHGCTAEGAVTGEKATGGIAGQNAGTLSGCVNHSAINTEQPEKENSLEDGLDHLNKEEVLDTTTDTGGIAGFSNGVVRNCRNEGTVGYAHVGYNVGGVAGRSSGYLENCTNTGAVKGRKDVGGVAGQIAPNIRLIFSPDTIGELRDELDRLNRMVDTTLDHTDSSRGTVNDRLDRLSDYARTASDSADQLSDAMSGWANSSINTINDSADTLADTLDRLEEITDGGEDPLDTLADGLDCLEDSLEQLSDAMGLGEDGLRKLAAAMDDLRNGLRQAQRAMEQIRTAILRLSDALVVNDPEGAAQARALLDSGAKQLSAALDQCGEALAGVTEVLRSGTPEDPALRDALAEYLSLLANGFRSAADAFSILGQGIITGLSSTSPDWNAVRASARDIVGAFRQLVSTLAAPGSSLEHLRQALTHFADMSGNLEGAFADLAEALDLFESASRDAGDTAGLIHDLFEDLSERDPISFDKLGDDFHQAEDDLHGAVNSLGDQMDLLRQELHTTGDTLSRDIRDLGDQFQVVANLILDAFSDTEVPDTEELWDDVSQERIDSTTLGKARGCTNTGPVEGDLNVGGTTGAMAIENDFDPEDDITEVGEKSLDFRYETRAILQDCVNSGSVTAKKDSAGGAVGRMDLGYVLNCENYGTIKSTGGDYVGGIAGVSRSTIRGCWSKCTLSGESYVGGIAGRGCELWQCVSLVAVEESQGYAGAVAGDWDREDGALSGNRFVEGSLAGVDGISYAGQAEPVAYGDLIQETGVPCAFRSFTVTYLVEDEALDTVIYSYGQPLSADLTPKVPEKAGCYGVWEDIGEDHITIDHVVEAVYTPCVTTLASAAMRDRVHPVFLVEGTFDGQTALQATPDRQKKTVEQWTVTLTDADEGEHRIRFTPPADWRGLSLRLLTEDGPADLQWEKDGSCCVFTVSGSSFTLEASSRSPGASLLPWLALAAAALAGISGGILLRRRRRPNVKV